MKNICLNLLIASAFCLSLNLNSATSDINGEVLDISQELMSTIVGREVAKGSSIEAMVDGLTPEEVAGVCDFAASKIENFGELVEKLS